MAKRDELPGLPAKLKAARESLGMSFTDAGEASKVHRVNIAAYEAGRQTPTLPVLFKLAVAYGVSPCDLLPIPEMSPPPAPPAAPAPASPRKRRKA